MNSRHGLWKLGNGGEKCTNRDATDEANTNKHNPVCDLRCFAHTFVHFARTGCLVTLYWVFHSDFRSVFRSFCVKSLSPSRTRRGSWPVKSTIADAFPSRLPASTIPSMAFRRSIASSTGSLIADSPLRFALVENNGPLFERRSRSQSSLGTRVAIVPLPRRRIAVRGAGQIFFTMGGTLAPRDSN